MIHLRRAVNQNQARKRRIPKFKGEEVREGFSTPFNVSDRKDIGNAQKYS